MVAGEHGSIKEVWRCAAPCRKEKTLNTGALFKGGRLSLEKLAQLLYHYLASNYCFHCIQYHLESTQITAAVKCMLH